MANTIQRKQIGGEATHVRDCYVWTEIHYLDSPSDYRECLPQDRYSNPDEGLAVLPSPRPSVRSVRSVVGPSLGIVLIAVLIALFWVLW
jgi:hypothetical protein